MWQARVMKPLVYAWPKSKNKQENPYNFLIYGAVESYKVAEFDHRKFSVEGANILHVHWPDRLLDDKRLWRLRWRCWRFLRAVDRLHSNGGKLIWTVHNLQSREIHYPILAEKLLKKFIEKVDGFIFLTGDSRQLFVQHYGNLKSFRSTIVPHPHYRDIYKKFSLSEARKALDIDEADFTLGFFGKIRENKGLDTLIASLDKTMSKDVRLLLAGSVKKRKLSNALTQYLDNNKNTITFLGYIDTEDVGKVIGACNALIFPYENILNSGSSLLALSLGRPIIAPNIGSFPELQRTVGDDWVYLYNQPLNAEKLKAAIHWAKTQASQMELPDLCYADPEKVSAATEQFYTEILQG